ncbi:MAG: HAMP domain-containing histidine kinase [Gammaproteobacteria bacterium]|nr:HAMP domain-containing histidine kinase [Gammaproteobacteria bacterium]
MKNDFDFLLASCIHDMKNAISLIMNSIDHLNEDCKKDTRKHLANLNYEASRLNNDLIHLLGVYRLQKDHLHVVIDEHDIWEIINEQHLKNQPLLQKYNLELTINGEEEEMWYFDPDLVASIINNIIVNTVRYTNSKIQINIKHENDYLCVEICDDGKGYPKEMMQNPGQKSDSIDFRSGSTKLGLYFASQIAEMHKNRDRTGYIELRNGGELGGGIFRLLLP